MFSMQKHFEKRAQSHGVYQTEPKSDWGSMGALYYLSIIFITLLQGSLTAYPYRYRGQKYGVDTN